MIRDFEEPKTDKLGLPEGMVEYSARTNFRDLMRIYGFENARQIMAEIINDEGGGRRTIEHG